MCAPRRLEQLPARAMIGRHASGLAAIRPEGVDMSGTVRISAVVAVIVLVLAGTAGFLLGQRASSVVFRTGVASPAPGAISAVSDGWTYDVPLDVPWTDARGVFHES